VFALTELIIGLLVIHVAWAYFFVCGSLLRTRGTPEAEAPLSHAEAVLEIVVGTASGIAITGIATFLLGLIHLLYPITFVGMVAATGVAFAALGDSPLRRSFWTRRFAVWCAALSPATVAIYAVALTLSAQAILPDMGSDATAYYYAYALEWARAHQIVVDLWLRFPYYADNWILLYSWMYELGLGRFCALLSWFASALSFFGIYGAVLVLTAPPAGERAFPRLMRHITALIAPATLLLSPAFLHWVDIGMVDVALGYFYFVTMICMILIVTRSRRPYLRDLIVCGAFLIGMKSSLIALVPLMALSVVFASRVLNLSTKRTLALVAILIALSSPWYARNFILASDPVAPVLNLALHGADRLDTVADLQLIKADLNVDHSIPGLLRLPLDIIVKTPARDFREPGVTWLLLLLGVPGIVLAYAIAKRGKGAALALSVAAAFIVYAVGYWNFTSHLARYSLLFYAALATVIASLAVLLAARLRAFCWAPAIPAVLMAVLAIPSPGSGSWLIAHWNETNGSEWYFYQGRERWLARSPEISAIRYTGSTLRAMGKWNTNVFALHLSSYFLFFVEEGLTGIGDWIGPGRYIDFVTAVESDQLRDYVDRLQIGAILVQTPERSLAFLGLARYWTDDDQRLLDEQAAALHFIKKLVPGGSYILYVRS